MKNDHMNDSGGNVFKALVLAGGRGKRLNDVTQETNKCMIHFNGKPLIEYSFENASALGVSEIVVVVGYLAEQIVNHYGNAYKGIPLKYVIQREQHGLVHAMECAKATIGDADFILLLGDEFFKGSDHASLLAKFRSEDALAVCGAIMVNDMSLIRKTYALLFDKETRRIYRLIEKPVKPSNNIMGTGNVIFKNKILDFIERTPISPQRGERELPDLIQCAVDDGEDVFFHVIAAQYVNVNSPEDTVQLKLLRNDG